jgi:uncharacterized membrane protein YsdA (DUF1294 family)/cold shock CspA family protein
VGGGPQVFVHIKAFSDRNRRPVENDVVSYETVLDDGGRPRAVNVAFAGESSRSRSEVRTSPVILPGLFLLFVAGAVLAGWLPFVVLGLYLLTSAVTFEVYARDKQAARRGAWRTAEDTLHLLGLFGGWPGALVAQRLLRHKSSKRSFQSVFWFSVVFNCAALAWALTPIGNAMLRRLLQASGLTALNL